MSTNFPEFSTPAGEAEAPLEMLSACHDRMQRQCATLKRLVPHLREEKELLPMAARLLSDNDLDRIGRAMLERRGIGDTGGI